MRQFDGVSNKTEPADRTGHCMSITGEKIAGHFTVTHKNTVLNCGILFTGWNIIINLNAFKYDRGHKILIWAMINFLNVKNLRNV